jgi:hypothetical protein
MPVAFAERRGKSFPAGTILLEPPGMTPELERLLDLATRPLETTPGLRDEAKGELMARASHSGVPYDRLDLSAPLDRLAGAKVRNPWPRRIAMLVALLALIGTLATTVAVQSRETAFMGMASLMSAMQRFGGGYSGAENPLFVDYLRRAAPELPLGMDLVSPEVGEGDTAAWLARNPDDLGMLQEHVTRRGLSTGAGWGMSGLTKEEKSTIGRLDADNALWPLMQVAPCLNQATGVPPTIGGRSGTGSSIHDEMEFQNALRNFSEAAAKPAYRDHSIALKRRQVDAFRRGETLARNHIALTFAGLVSPVFEEYSGTLATLAKFHCDRLVAAGDKEGLARFSGEWQRLARTIAKSEAPVGSGTHVVMSQLKDMSDPIAGALDQLGMAAELNEVEQFYLVLTDFEAGVPIYTMPPEIKAIAGARLSGFGMTQVPRDLTAAELLPSRRTELAFLDRAIAAFLAVLAMIFTGLVGLEAYRRSRIVKGMARGLMPLFRPVDHLWIGALGLGLPWLWWWTLTRLSPLGLRDLEFLPWQVLIWLLQPAAAFLFALVLLLQTARWRWGKRGGFLGLQPSLGGLGWAIAGLTGMALPVSGLFRYLKLTQQQSEIFVIAVAGMAACGLLWLLWEGTMNLFTPRTSALRPNLAMRVLLPWSLAGVMTLLISGAVSTAMERRWLALDPLLPTWTSGSHVNALEERVAAELREKLRGL